MSLKSILHAAGSRWRSAAKVLNVLVLLSLLLAGQTPAPARALGATLYVRSIPAGLNNCSSWANACNLQSALTTAVATDQIWVAQGTYRPHATDESVSFVLKSGVSIYGGFTTSMTLLTERNPGFYVTTLSGDINNAGVVEDNSWHVVRGGGANSTAVLDGFKITGGYAVDADTSDDQSGGGVYNDVNGVGSSPTLRNLWITGNSARFAGGMENDGGSPTLINVTFNANTALSATDPTPASGGSGGAMGNFNSVPSLTNVTFSGNTATVTAGGMNNSGSDPILQNVTFSGNTAGSSGAMYNGASSPSIYDSIFYGDSSEIGGTSPATIIDSIVSGGCPSPGSCTNLLTSDPLLGVLGNYGGWTQTLPLQGGSPAIDAGGVTTACPPPSTDQRGVIRPQGGSCDIGAVEYSAITISGNAGVAGAVLNYVDVTAKAVTAGGGGLYALSVPSGWSGTVTPALSGYLFSPSSRTYSIVTTNRTSQNYTATLLTPQIVRLYPPDLSTVCLTPKIGAFILLGDAMRPFGVFDPSTITLWLDASDVTGAASITDSMEYPQISATILYTPPAPLSLGLHTVQLDYPTGAGPQSLIWTFTAAAIGCTFAPQPSTGPESDQPSPSPDGVGPDSSGADNH